MLIKYTELWDKIKNLIKAIYGCEADMYEKDFMETKFNSHDNLHLNEILKLHNMTANITLKFF